MQQVLTEIAREMVAAKACGQNSTHTLDQARVHLTTSAVVPGPTTELGDLDEATFPGYARSGAITWDTPLIGPGSLISIMGDTKEFACNGTSNETITGAFLAHNAAGNGATPDTLLAVEMFDQPVPVNRDGQGVRYFPHFEYP